MVKKAPWDVEMECLFVDICHQHARLGFLIETELKGGYRGKGEAPKRKKSLPALGGAAWVEARG